MGDLFPWSSRGLSMNTVGGAHRAGKSHPGVGREVLPFIDNPSLPFLKNGIMTSRFVPVPPHIFNLMRRSSRLRSIQHIFGGTKNEAPMQWNAIEASGVPSTALERTHA